MLARDYSLFVVWVNSVVAGVSILSNGGVGFDARGGSPRPPSLEMPCSLGGEASGSGRVPLAVITVTWGTRGPRRMMEG